jgi:hypothetical protein
MTEPFETVLTWALVLLAGLVFALGVAAVLIGLTWAAVWIYRTVQDQRRAMKFWRGQGDE